MQAWAQKSSSSVKTYSVFCGWSSPMLLFDRMAEAMTPARWYSPTRRSKKLVLPLHVHATQSVSDSVRPRAPPNCTRAHHRISSKV